MELDLRGYITWLRAFCFLVCSGGGGWCGFGISPWFFGVDWEKVLITRQNGGRS